MFVSTSIYKERVYENAGLTELIELIETGERKFLDIGCGAGGNAKLLKEKVPNSVIVGITLSSAEAELARSYMDKVVVTDIENWEPEDLEDLFDAVIVCHTLEHMVDPLAVLRKMKKFLKRGGHLYMALPNVMFYRQRLEFLRGRFRYTETGLMDKTHLRFFDWESAGEIVTHAGFQIEKRMAVGSFPQWKFRKVSPKLAHRIDRWATGSFPNLFGWHIIIKAAQQCRESLLS